MQHAWTYNAQNRLQQVDLTDHAGTLLRRFRYDLDATGQRTGVTELAGASLAQRRRAAYEYDLQYFPSGSPPQTMSRVHRLTMERLFDAGNNDAGTRRHAYDAVGNQTEREQGGTLKLLGYDARDQINAADQVILTGVYDANGNTLKDENGAATGDLYDAENRLIQRGTGSGSIYLNYDHEGNRVSKTVGATTTYYLVDTLNPSGYAQVLAEFSSVTASVAPTVRYNHGLELISQTSQLATRFYGYDGQGSVRLLTDAVTTSGATVTTVTDTYDYDAYGLLLASTPATGATANHYRYTGQQWDEDLGLYYLRARYYQPALGRFWTMDSYEGNLDEPTSLHRYLYCQANPSNSSDPSGNDPDMPSLMLTVKTWGYLAVSFTIRAAPAINRATVLLFEMTTGETVIVGAGTAVGAGAAMSKIEGGIGSWVEAVGSVRSAIIGTKAYVSEVLRGTGAQASHLNQAKAYTRINYDYGACVGLVGNVFSKVTTEHREFHVVMERFWSQYRIGGSKAGRPVSNREYLNAMGEAFGAVKDSTSGAAKFAKSEIDALVKLAEKEQIGNGYHDGPGGFRPLIPPSTNVK